MSVRRAAGDSSEQTLVAALWRALDGYRMLSLVYAAWLCWRRHAELTHPAVAVVVLAVLAAWTLTMLVHRRRDALVMGIELVLAVLGVLATIACESPSARDSGAGTLPALWAAAPVMGWAVLAGLRGGIVAAAAVAVADLLTAGRPTDGTVYNIVTLVLLGGCLGACVDIARRAQRALAEALRVQAEQAERDRLARTIHDGVLQSLAFIHRRGEQLGGEAAALGVLAAEQERELRTLALGPRRAGGTQQVDLRSALAALQSASVTVSTPASPIGWAADRAAELVAAVEAALSNVERHAGPDARAWVLVEDLGTDLVVTVRDNGAGYAPGRREDAAREGRLGIRSSIDGRVRELGGTTVHRSVPGQGTTVEITVPRV